MQSDEKVCTPRNPRHRPGCRCPVCNQDHRDGCTCVRCRRGDDRGAGALNERAAALVEAVADAAVTGDIDLDAVAKVAGYRDAAAVTGAITGSRRIREALRAALIRRGITPDRMASLARGGLRATRDDGRPDWRERRGWWELVARVHGATGRDAEDRPSAGPVAIMVSAGQTGDAHPADCTCQACLDAWERRAQAVLERRRRLLAEFTGTLR